MVEQFAPTPINTTITIRPVVSATQQHDATGVQTQLAALPPGTVIEGFVINRDAHNNPILRTPHGDLQMQSDVFMKTGSQVVIRVDANSESRARIVSVDGLEPQEYGALQTRGLTKDSIMPSQLLQKAPGVAPGTTPAAQQGLSLQALLLQPASAGAPHLPNHALLAAFASATGPLPAGLMKLQAGAALKVMLLDVQLPPIPTAGQPSAAPNPTPATSTSPTVSTPHSPSPQTAAALLGGQGGIEKSTAAASMANRHAAQTAMAESPAAPPPSQSAFPASPSFTPTSAATAPTTSPTAQPAVVIGTEADGATILHTRFGALKIFTPSPLPVGTQLMIDVTPETHTTPAVSTLPVTSENEETIANFARGWPALAEAAQWLRDNDPALARELAQQLPNAGPKLASGLLFFIAALKGGDVNELLGKRVIGKLDMMLSGVSGKLKRDTTQMQQLFTQSPMQHWSGVLLPIMVEGALEHARLYVRNESEDSEEKTKSASGKGGSQRFIIEVDLSHLGDMQFDGFVQQKTGNQFDLVIRTARPLDPTIGNDIRSLFEQALKTTGYKGYLHFQQGAQHFIRPLAELDNIPTHDQHTILA